MAVNLLDMAKGYLTDAVVSRVSGSLNEDPESIHKTLTGAFPIFLGGLISHSSSPDGPTMLTGLIERFMPGPTTPQATVPDADDPDTLISKGSGLSESVFGANSGHISGALAQFSGVKNTSAASLLSMAGSVITGLVGRQLMTQGGGVNTNSLMSLLADQRDAVASAMPPGLSSLLDTHSDLGGMTSMVGGLSGAASSPVTGAATAMGAAIAGAAGTPPTPPPVDVPKRVVSTPAYSDNINDRPKGFNVWPWLLAALAAGLLFYFLRGGSDETADTATISSSNDTTSASVPDVTATASTAGMDSAANSAGVLIDSARSSVATDAGTAASLGTFAARKLPDGIELNIPANGIENKLITFIDDQSQTVDKTTWFNFDRLSYETGSATLKPESREQLQNIAAILKAYPAVNLKIGGYTDNVGNAAANKKLSQRRAESAMTELVRLGVDQARLEAEGYGQEQPIASNNTEEGRAQNRRTAVRVTKK
ncbi:MAG TPA: OmpA family protein [Fibrella sp.]